MGVVPLVWGPLERFDFRSHLRTDLDITLVGWSCRIKRVSWNLQVALIRVSNVVGLNLGWSGLCRDVVGKLFVTLGSFFAFEAIIVFFLHSIKALGMMLFHGAAIASNLLDEADHGLGALGIKIIIWICPEIWKSLDSFYNWISGILDVVPEISDESGTVFEFYSYCLIINCWPSSRHNLSTLRSCCLELIVELHVPHRFLCEFKLMSSIDNLNVIWPSMSAYFFAFK